MDNAILPTPHVLRDGHVACLAQAVLPARVGTDGVPTLLGFRPLGREGLKLRWTRPALNDLIAAQTYIAQDNPQAAQAVAQRLWDAAQSPVGWARHPCPRAKTNIHYTTRSNMDNAILPTPHVLRDGLVACLAQAALPARVGTGGVPTLLG
jgi:plasmid stabilization system protein ParE